ncbi:hypothetical protein [Luteimonas deserti]|uniref:Tail specific protease domain-containing protein n=1 Tax=Luteimonas deserti TaxID=2752306 RepID=A0A7Z0QTQ5_9GAMM|nr:hypothetical protein [Luteimonas deserti]NYZ63884.1 hypothetical protein [Luteimonas deserti]
MTFGPCRAPGQPLQFRLPRWNPATRLSPACLLMLALALPAAAADGAPDWPDTLERDVRAFHAALRDSHPGPVDPANPGFAAALDAGLEQALARVPRTLDFAGYWWALREFQASFDDGHVQLATRDAAPTLPTRWPGFLTRSSDGDHVVATRLDDDALPALDARLLDCDGIDADALAQAVVGRFRGLWDLNAQRVAHAGRLFLDAGNPWVARPVACRFQEGARVRRVMLDWRDLEPAGLAERLTATRRLQATTTGVRTPRRGQLWIAAGSFSAERDAPALTALLSDLDDTARVRAARRVVLDLRGNGGGSSHWGREIARRLWGDAALAALPPGDSRVDWRVDAANLAAIRDFGAMLRAQPDPDAVMLHWVDIVDRGMSAALGRGEALWRHPADAEAMPAPPAPRPRAMAADVPVFVLADAACASACLDALDLWLPLGAVLVGGETSADTVYMDVREQTLPSGLAAVAIPMKVYRGRSRGHNQPYRPAHAWRGAFSDEAALAAWIDGLPPAGATPATHTR